MAAKLEENERKYPADRARGKSDKYTRLSGALWTAPDLLSDRDKPGSSRGAQVPPR